MPVIQTTAIAPTTLQTTTNTTITERTPVLTNSPIRTSGKPEHVSTVGIETLPTEHAAGNSSTQGGLGSRTGRGGMVAVAVVVPLVLVLATITVFVLYRKR